MDANALTEKMIDTLMLALWVSSPVLITSVLVALLVGFFQSATQIRETAISAVPKLLAVSLVLVLFGAWMGTEVLSWTRTLFEAVSRVMR